jgi:hypothetical protein
LFAVLFAWSTIVFGTFVLAASRSSSNRSDCSGYHLSPAPLNSRHAAFTATVIRTAHQEKILGKWAGVWAVARVDQLFWGVSSSFVLLTGGTFVEGHPFLVSGFHSEGRLAGALPIVDVQQCGVAALPLSRAEVPLRVLRNWKIPAQLKIIGEVRSETRYPVKPETMESMFLPRTDSKPLVGATVCLKSANQTVLAKTDEHGIYEFLEVPADDKFVTSVRDPPLGQTSMEHPYEKSPFPTIWPLWCDLRTFVEKR